MTAGPPPSNEPIPARVLALAAGRPLRCVWRNELGGLTYEVGTLADRVFVKWSPATAGIDLAREIARLRWAAAFTVVPRVLDQGADASGTWMVTAPLEGESAVSERWTANPAKAVVAIGEGLRRLHDALPVDTCPFSWSREARYDAICRAAAAGKIDPSRWHPSHRSLSVDEALKRLAVAPPIDRLVVCHGDTCAPNTLLAEDGRFTGHVDLGALGVADRWADLAIATWSTQWNYGPGWEEPLLEAYGITADPERIAYYRLLADLDQEEP
ncbi:aminoglycoside 3'-phosphotransferase [Pendulispora albinea]|uniref:Aminoglycoside 3'-phosphotransferase n=1 Tax=Pendulispora albinea TaxID=2741071 RepID=A0ABZ2M043_9BACT